MSSPLKDLRHASWPHILERAGKAMRDALEASLRPLFTLVAQQLTQQLVEAVAPLLSRDWTELKRVIEAILPPPGTLDGDVLILFASRQGGEREAALDRLAPRFSRRGVFHPERWRLLEDKYRAFGGGLWPHLVKSALLIACDDIPGELPLEDLPRWLRNKVRTEIERALLDGYTLDERMARRTILLPDTPELLVEEEAAEIDRLEDALSLQGELARLPLNDLMLVQLVASGYSLKDAAKRLGVSPAAARKKWQRLREKIS